MPCAFLYASLSWPFLAYIHITGPLVTMLQPDRISLIHVHVHCVPFFSTPVKMEPK